MNERMTLSQLEPVDQNAVVAVLADWAEESGDARPLGRALAGGDLLGDRDPAAVSKRMRDRIAAVLTRRIPADPCPDAPDCPHPACRD
jgi:hypothetical protein